MFRGIGFGAERIGLAALEFPKCAGVCLLAFLVILGFSLPNVTFDDDIHRVFLSDSPLSKAQIAYEDEQSPRLSTVLVHVTAPRPFTVEDMNATRDLALDLEFVDGVTAVASPFVLRWPPESEAPSGKPVFGVEIPADYADDLAAFKALGTGLPTFINETRTAMLLALSVNVEATAISDAADQISGEVSRALPVTLSADLTGEDIISAEIVSGLKADLISLNLWGAMIVTLGAFVLLRDLRMALLAVIPAILGAAGVLALSVWLGYPITVLSNVIPILLLVLGVANGVHLADHIKKGGTLRDALMTVGPACALTALTTAVAFASITLTGNAQLFEFAILGALGTIFAFITVIVTFALLGRRLAVSQCPVPDITAHAARLLTRAGAARPSATIAACVILLVMCIWGFSQTKAWFPLYQNLPDNSATVATNDAISAEFGGAFQMIIETGGDWEETTALVQRLEAMAGPSAVLSEVSFARWLGRPDVRPTPEDLSTLPRALVQQLQTHNGAARVFVSVPEPMRDDATLAAFDQLYDTAVQAGADRIIGLPTVMRQEAVNLIDQLSIGLVAAAVGATVLVAFAFRSITLVPVLLIPNVLPLMLTGASLHIWAQSELSPTAVLALTIAFGIAIDDTVHFLNRYSAAKSAGGSARDALTRAARSAGQVIVLTTLLLTIGLSVTLLSDFTPIRLFGTMMITTLWAALLTDLLLLPAMLTWKDSTHGKA